MHHREVVGTLRVGVDVVQEEVRDVLDARHAPLADGVVQRSESAAGGNEVHRRFARGAPIVHGVGDALPARPLDVDPLAPGDVVAVVPRHVDAGAAVEAVPSLVEEDASIGVGVDRETVEMVGAFVRRAPGRVVGERNGFGDHERVDLSAREHGARVHALRVARILPVHPKRRAVDDLEGDFARAALSRDEIGEHVGQSQTDEAVADEQDVLVERRFDDRLVRGGGAGALGQRRRHGAEDQQCSSERSHVIAAPVARGFREGKRRLDALSSARVVYFVDFELFVSEIGLGLEYD